MSAYRKFEIKRLSKTRDISIINLKIFNLFLIQTGSQYYQRSLIRLAGFNETTVVYVGLMVKQKTSKRDTYYGVSKKVESLKMISILEFSKVFVLICTGIQGFRKILTFRGCAGRF